MGTSFAVEELFPLDILMDACVLACVQLALDRFCLRRLFRATLVMVFFTVACILLGLRNLALQLLICPIAAFALLGRRRVRQILEAACGIFCCYGAAGGFFHLVGRWSPAILPCMPLFALLLRRRNIRAQWIVEVRLEYKGAHACFSALIDTGNRLREHRSKLPVLIVQASVLGALSDKIEPSDCVFLPYGVLGSSGEIACFHPDRLMMRVGDRWKHAPECLAAVFPDRIPGRFRALAPPEFILQSEHGFFPDALIKRYRRFYHGVFKHKAIHLWSCRTDSPGFGMLHRRK